MTRRIHFFSALASGFFAALVGAITPAFAQTSAPLTLGDAMSRALSANRTIAAARLQRPVDAAGVDVARERLNPEFAYEAAREMPHQSFGLTVPIELGGKRQARIAFAEATVAASEAEIARLIAEVRNDVRRAYFEVVAADRQMTIATDLRALAARARDAARARVDAGDVPRSDLVQAELAFMSAENEVTAARGETAATRASLNALLGQAPDVRLTLADDLAAGDIPTLQDAIAQASQVNGELQTIDRRIAAQAARRTLANALRSPDIAAGATFVYDAQPEFQYGWRASFGITLPVFTSHRAGVLVENAELARLKAEREGVSARMTGAIAAALARAASTREQITRYDADILPRVLESDQMAQEAYNAGQIGLPLLIQALQTARDMRQRGLQASLDYQRALADLERAIGAPIR